MNFLYETKGILELHGKTLKDIISIQFGGTVGIPVEDFPALADFEYDDGFGSPEIPTDLLIIGDDWWLERREYDGSEWWEYKTKPVACKVIGKVKNIRKCNPYEVRILRIREEINSEDKKRTKLTRLEKAYSMLSDFDKRHAGEILEGQCPHNYGLAEDCEASESCVTCWLTEVEE